MAGRKSTILRPKVIRFGEHKISFRLAPGTIDERRQVCFLKEPWTPVGRVAAQPETVDVLSARIYPLLSALSRSAVISTLSRAHGAVRFRFAYRPTKRNEPTGRFNLNRAARALVYIKRYIEIVRLDIDCVVGTRYYLLPILPHNERSELSLRFEERTDKSTDASNLGRCAPPLGPRPGVYWGAGLYWGGGVGFYGARRTRGTPRCHFSFSFPFPFPG